ncbi:Calx-beta domain-containing protein [Hydrocarboniphaga sp.]|uniref:Calx-beta domain-containing protein n=1 Tax=Hydrocarboniphaga sp. TaxID=2033016 RepID=UPI003D14002D
MEGNAISLQISRSGHTASAVALTVAAANGSATASVNYTPPQNSYTLLAGQSSGSFPVATIRDGKYNTDLSFTVSISTSNPAVQIGNSTATVTVGNNNTLDPAPIFSISGPTAVTESNTATYTVTRTNATALTHSVNYMTTPGTAAAGVDYTPVSGQFTFAPTDSPKTFPVNTLDDAVFDQNRTFSASINTPTAGATLGTSSVTTTINDNDPAPVFTISGANPSSVVEGGSMAFTVTKTNATKLSHSVSFVPVNGTAISGTDFNVATASPLVFGSADATRPITVNTVADAANEGATPETFSISLTSASNGAGIGSPSSGSGSIQESQLVIPGVPGPIVPASQSNLTGNTFGVNWGASAGTVTAYELYKERTTGGNGQALVYSGTATSYAGAIQSGSASVEWDVRVRACNNVGCSAYTEDAQVTICSGGVCP